MTSKYDPLGSHLRQLKIIEWHATFAAIERVLGFKLPASAGRYPAWWENNNPSSRQSGSWLDAGWMTKNLNLAGETVTFIRK